MVELALPFLMTRGNVPAKRAFRGQFAAPTVVLEQLLSPKGNVIVRNQTSLLIAAAAAIALFTAPAFAQSAAPAPAATAPAKAAPAKTAAPAKAATKSHKRDCYDLAWQSQAMQDCLAKQSAKQSATTTPAPKKAAVTKAKATKKASAAPTAAPATPATPTK